MSDFTAYFQPKVISFFNGDEQYKSPFDQAAARASGKKPGRSKGSRDKERVLDLYREQNKEYLYLGLSLSSIRTILNPQLEIPLAIHLIGISFVKMQNYLSFGKQRKEKGGFLPYIYARKWEIPKYAQYPLHEY